jgi:hypothetical protein
MEAAALANGRTVVTHTHMCGQDDSATAGGTRGHSNPCRAETPRPHPDEQAPPQQGRVARKRGRSMLLKRMKRGLTVLGLGAILMTGVSTSGLAATAQPAQPQTYRGQIREITIDQCGLEPGTCAGSLVLAQARSQEVTLAIPQGTTIQRGDDRVHLEQLGIGNYITVQAVRQPGDQDYSGNGRNWTWQEFDAYERSPVNSPTQGD